MVYISNLNLLMLYKIGAWSLAYKAPFESKHLLIQNDEAILNHDIWDPEFLILPTHLHIMWYPDLVSMFECRFIFC